MIQLILFLVAIGAGLYGAITGNVLALTCAMIGMFIGASGFVTPAPEQQLARQQRIREWLHQYGWVLFLFLAVGAEGLTIQQLATNEFSKSSSFYWLIGIILVIIAGIVHDRTIRMSVTDAAATRSNHEAPATVDKDVDADVDTARVAAGGPAHSAPAVAQQRADTTSTVANTTEEEEQPVVAQPSPPMSPSGQPSRRWARIGELYHRTSQSLQNAVYDQRLDWLLILLITGVALWIRLHRLSDFLPSMHGDEGEMGELARLALRGPESGLRPTPLPLFSTGFLDHPTLFHYLQAVGLAIFGDSLSGLRTLSAVFGALCVPPLYLLAKHGWGRIAAITGAWLLAVSHLHIHYSRIALNNIQSVWAMIVLVMLFVVAAQRHQRNKPQPILLYLLAGLTIGLSQYFYYGSRLLPVVAGLCVLYLLVARRITFAQFFGLGVASLIPYVPLLHLFSRNWQSFLNRTRGVSIFNPEGLTHTLGADATWPQDIPLLFWEQLKRNIGFFVDSGDRSAFYLQDLPGFDSLTVVLFWLGLGLVLARSRTFQNFVLGIWFISGLLLAGILSL